MKNEILGAKAPKKECTDQKCPFHRSLNVKKETARGIVVSRDAHHSAAIEWKRSKYVSKYERYEMRKSKLRAHNPACLNAQVGQEVLVARTRPLSKTKNHVIIAIIDKESKEAKKSKASDKKQAKENKSKSTEE